MEFIHTPYHGKSARTAPSIKKQMYGVNLSIIMNNISFLPEWKIYLWKKLLFNEDPETEVYVPQDFILFDLTEQVSIRRRMVQDLADGLEKEKRLAIAQRRMPSFEYSPPTPPNDQYFSFKLRDIMIALIDLAKDASPSLEINRVHLSWSYINNYRREKLTYQAKQHNIQVAGLGSGSTQSKPKLRFNDKFYDLGEELFNKVERKDELSIEELEEIVLKDYPVDMWSNLSFGIKINKKSLAKKLSDYLELFMTDELLPPPQVRYYNYRQQRELIAPAISLFAQKYGRKNISITMEELAKLGGWYQREENHLRFWETMFALEKVKNFNIKGIRKSELVISLSDDFPRVQKYLPKEVISSTLVEVKKKTHIEEQHPVEPKKPYTVVEKGRGYLILDGEKILIGESDSNKFRLVEVLCGPFGVGKTIDAIFTHIKHTGVDDPSFADAYLSRSKKVTLIQGTLKEVQRAISQYKRENKLKKLSKLKLKLGNNQFWFEMTHS